MLFRLLRAHLPPYAVQVTVVVTLVLIQAIANLYLPNLNADLINNGVAKGDLARIWGTGAEMLAVTLVLGVVSLVAAYFSARASMGIGRDIRASVFERVQQFSQRELNQFGTASLITRNTNDIQQVQLLMQMGLTVMVMAPVTAIGGVVMAIHEDLRLSALLIVIIPVMAVVLGVLLAFAVPLFTVVQQRIDRINQVLREQVTGVRVIRAFIRTRHEEARFAKANLDLMTTALRVNRIFALALPALFVVMNLSSVAVLWFGGHLVDSGQLPVGNLTAFLAYILQIMFSVMMAVMMVVLVPRAVASANRVQAVLEVEPGIVDPPAPVEPAQASGLVQFRDVTFGYPGSERPVLHDVTFELQPGQTSAIIGGTGAGKTTLLNLVPRSFDVTEGQVLVDGVDVREQALERLWSRIGLVPQRAYLFRGTVAENLRFGNPGATDEELWHALEVAQARDFVEAMAEGLDARIDQGGTNVSGGQRQRLSIARAIIKRPQIYLFDDCFSALDAATDARLRAALRAETSDATVVIVAQRVSTILHADRIVVLDAGRVVGIGRHDELLVTCEPYREIVESQLGAEAAA